jgi:hypothetical protein
MVVDMRFFKSPPTEGRRRHRNVPKPPKWQAKRNRLPPTLGQNFRGLQLSDANVVNRDNNLLFTTAAALPVALSITKDVWLPSNDVGVYPRIA